MKSHEKIEVEHHHLTSMSNFSLWSFDCELNDDEDLELCNLLFKSKCWAGEAFIKYVTFEENHRNYKWSFFEFSGWYVHEVESFDTMKFETCLMNLVANAIGTKVYNSYHDYVEQLINNGMEDFEIHDLRIN